MEPVRHHIWNNLPLRVKGLMLLMVPLPALMAAAVVLSGTWREERQALVAVERLANARQQLQEISTVLLVPGKPAQDYQVLARSVEDIGRIIANPERRREIEIAIQRKLDALAGLNQTEATNDLLIDADREATRSLQSYVSAVIPECDQLISRELHNAKMARSKLFVLSLQGTFVFLLGELLAALVFLGAVSGQIQTLKANSRLLAAGQPLLPLFTDNWELNQIGCDLVKASVALSRRADEPEASSRTASHPEMPGSRVAEQRYESMTDQLHERNRELAAALVTARETLAQRRHFLTDLSRELRIPLSSILGFSELLYDAKLGPVNEQQKGCLSDILAGSKRLLQLADNVTGAAHAEAAPALASNDVIDFQKLVKEVKYALIPAARKKGVSVEVDVDPELTQIRADRGRLQDSLRQHVANAIEFTPHDASLEVHVRPEGTNALRLEVRSTGIGLPPKDVVRLFPEFRLNPPTTVAETWPENNSSRQSEIFYAILSGIARSSQPVTSGVDAHAAA
jgi:signal transduction histidine kinase